MRVILVDESEGGLAGHNAVYRNAINMIEGTEIFNNVAKFPSLTKHPIQGMLSRWNYISRIPTGDIICLLHLDTIYAVPILFRKLAKTNSRIVGVLHWFPKDERRQRLFRSTARYLDAVVVHSEYIKKQLNSIGVNNVVVIDYPVFCNVDVLSLHKRGQNQKKVFTCLGGSRSDKGPDILAAAFEYIPRNLRDNIRIVIAGKELDIPYAYIRKKAEENGIEIDFCDKRMSDEEYWQYIVDTDVILLPYKRIFTGNSGPMADGVFLNKFILGPDEGNLGYLIGKYNLGSTFHIENPESLGLEIGRVSMLNTECDHDYRNKLGVQDFVNSYRELFNKLSGKK